ncbi:MAG: hypothetical protein ACRDQ0_02860, partial [Pseudonocardia sp.]
MFTRCTGRHAVRSATYRRGQFRRLHGRVAVQDGRDDVDHGAGGEARGDPPRRDAGRKDRVVNVAQRNSLQQTVNRLARGRARRLVDAPRPGRTA